ncbi:MAG: transcriptional regulator [Bacteroidetes bacterium 4572_77]|nr:MAG: transcriptional regulator [Bacteroidetes bacterium 4572_77]
MKKIKIFVSSVQNEFSYERKMLYEYFLADPLLGRFFELFLFEQLPAIDQKVDTVYLKEVQRCDIYLGILGNDYGSEDKEGISPTEREFDFATKHNKTRLIFISNSENRNPKEIKFNKKAQSVLVRKSFSAIGELKSSAYAAMVKYLMEKEVIRTAPFDASIDGKASIKDIDSEKIRQFIRLAKSKRGFVLEESVEPETLLTYLNLMDGDRVKNGAVLLFGKTPQRFFISSEIRCAYFQGVEVEKPIQSYKVFKGDVFELVNHAIEFVLNKLDYKVETRKEHVQIPGSYEIPKEIIAEAIVNAVVHRDYTSNASVQIMMFRDRIEIWNPGSLPLGWTTEKLKKLHNSIPANPLLAEPMYLTAFIETPQVTPQVIKLIMLISGEMSREEIQKELHLSDKRNYINNYQNPAIKKGYLEMTIPHKPKSKNQKYRLTQKGLALKSSEKSR